MLDILQADDIDFDHYLAETEPGEKVRPAREYLDEIMHQISPAHDTPKHPKLPFAGAWVYFPPGEVTLWGGFNGSGKSMLTGQAVTGFAEAGQKACIASFEMKPAKTLTRINRQVYGSATPTRAQVEGFLSRTDGRLWVYDQQGTVKSDRLIAVIKHCAETLGCHHIVVDSLMKCVMGEDDYTGQKRFVDELTACARDFNTHIHLVAHLKKGDTDERLPTKMDVKGSGAITDLVDNVLILWRNKKKERDIDAGKQVNDSDPDAILICDKNRNGDYEGRTKLWYDRQSLRFSDSHVGRRGLAKDLPK